MTDASAGCEPQLTRRPMIYFFFRGALDVGITTGAELTLDEIRIKHHDILFRWGPRSR